MGVDRRAAAAAGVPRDLEGNWKIVGRAHLAREKNFAIRENFVCIWGKMGYNKVEKSSALSTYIRRLAKWQK